MESGQSTTWPGTSRECQWHMIQSSLRASSPLGSRARFSGASGEASRERFGAGVREGELATITEEISFPLPLREGKYHWLKNDILSIINY